MLTVLMHAYIDIIFWCDPQCLYDKHDLLLLNFLKCKFEEHTLFYHKENIL